MTHNVGTVQSKRPAAFAGDHSIRSTTKLGGTVSCPHSEHRSSLKEGCRKAVLGVCVLPSQETSPQSRWHWQPTATMVTDGSLKTPIASCLNTLHFVVLEAGGCLRVRAHHLHLHWAAFARPFGLMSAHRI